jgi:hypothetical protein
MVDVGVGRCGLPPPYTLFLIHQPRTLRTSVHCSADGVRGLRLTLSHKFVVLIVP